MKQRVVSLFCLIAAGCAAPPAGEPPPAPKPAPVTSAIVPAKAPSVSESIMTYVLKVRNLTNSVLTDEVHKMREALAREKSDANRLKLAVVLVQSGSTDEAEILSLVDPATQEHVDPGLRGLAVLLHTALTDRRKTREALLATQGRLRDTQKSQESTLARSDQLKKQVEELEKKLTALKSIEKSLIQRK
jgi:hypothetical protein